MNKAKRLARSKRKAKLNNALCQQRKGNRAKAKRKSAKLASDLKTYLAEKGVK